MYCILTLINGREILLPQEGNRPLHQNICKLGAEVNKKVHGWIGMFKTKSLPKRVRINRI
jgi:hypothetical protein